MTDCTSPEGHEWHIVRDGKTGQVWIRCFRNECYEKRTREEAEAILNAHASLTAEIEYIGELTGIAGVDSPMSVRDCVLALQQENGRLREGVGAARDQIGDRTHGAMLSELDALVAEKVMGWHRRKRDERWLDKNGRAVEWICFDCGNGEFLPSTRIEDAWQVVEKMSCTTKEFWHFKYFSTGAVARFEYEGGRDLPWTAGEYEADAEEMPLAICLAALKAVGVEI